MLPQPQPLRIFWHRELKPGEAALSDLYPPRARGLCHPGSPARLPIGLQLDASASFSCAQICARYFSGGSPSSRQASQPRIKSPAPKQSGISQRQSNDFIQIFAGMPALSALTSAMRQRPRCTHRPPSAVSQAGLILPSGSLQVQRSKAIDPSGSPPCAAAAWLS